MERDKVAELYKKYSLTKTDIFNHKHYLIITRSGIEKIQAIEQIKVKFEVVRAEKDFAVVKAIGNGNFETFGSAIKGVDFASGNTNSWYLMEIAEKRALSRIILKVTGLYSHGFYGEDESETFKATKKTPEEKLEEIQELYLEKSDKLSAKDLADLDRIINEKEVNSYDKVLRNLKKL